MNIALNMCIALFLVAFVANLAHWNTRQGEQFTYAPAGGWWSGLLMVSSIVAAFATVLWFVRICPLEIAAGLSLILMSLAQLYSLRHRWQLRLSRMQR